MTDQTGGATPEDSNPINASDQASDERDRRSARRDGTSDIRDSRAADRDHTSQGRDQNAERRDSAADDRDRAARHLEAGSLTASRDTGERRRQLLGRRASDVHASSDRASAALDRADAASDRKAAGADRRKGAHDRTDAARDRALASVDRHASAGEREASSVDDLTGAYRRGTGLVELEREMMRAKRTRQPFVVAFVDVDGLKSINDSLGHDAGDQVLRRVVDAMRAHLRSYDLMVRLGGDEFVCGLSNVGFAKAAERFERINLDLSADRSSVTVGLAELDDGESLVELIAAADRALYEERRIRGGS